ncbi:hypothetical protein [Aureibacter tunicatorum]|uniref:Uncharacterized protein n=1 Tax=Aureibacter tunicatorum TaxID=866807 RepID=A0AAE3XNI6_9BACT|nr:hypothetical protein [Aureibacter tunicatorum]MDR6239145.1 hypothetical protein [Aureibacter tunicatorum]
MRRQIHEDFSYFLKKGRFVVHNTIAGGVIFLKEPEIIRSLQIYYDSLSNVSIVVVEYPEPRNATNVKYKPNVGSQEHAEWNMEAIFPNFRNYDLIIQKSLMLFWANYVKSICETYQKNSWFMRYTDRFELNVFWDNKLEFAITVDNGV